MTVKKNMVCITVLIGILSTSCAPVDSYEVPTDDLVNQKSVEIAIAWLNQEIGCNMFTKVQSNHRDWKYMFPRRGRITIQVKPSRVKPGKIGRTVWSMRCGARARIFVRSKNASPGLFAHELGHAVCLKKHKPGTFMSRSTPIFWQDGEWQGPVMSDGQRKSLRRKCEDMQDERVLAE